MKKSYILAFSAIFFWSTMATVSKLLLGSFSGIFVLLVSSVFAFLFLLIKNIFTHNLLKLREYSFKDIIIMVLIGLRRGDNARFSGVYNQLSLADNEHYFRVHYS